MNDRMNAREQAPHHRWTDTLSGLWTAIWTAWTALDSEPPTVTH